MNNLAALSSSIYALVDCNSFYCSCERVFNPKITHRPVIVLSNNDGCVVSRTDEAKALNIPMGVPFFEVKDIVKKHKVATYSSNYTLYGDMSGRVMKTLSAFTPDLQIYSIDEAFLPLQGLDIKDLTAYGKKIKTTVWQHTGIPTCVGIGPTRVLAKLANQVAKKNKGATDGVLDLTKPELREKILSQFPVEDIWGVGRKSAAKLRYHHIDTAAQMRDADPAFIHKILHIQGRRIADELRGLSCISPDGLGSEQKQIMSTRSFGKSIFSLEDLKEAIANHVTSASEKLRRNEQQARILSIFIRTNRFKSDEQYYNSAFISLGAGSQSTPKLIKHAHRLLEKIYIKKYEYKKCGVILSDLYSVSSQQLDFFGEADNAKDQRLMQVIDAVNTRNGKNTLKFASCGINPFWKMLSEMKSQNFTTQWSELLNVKV